MKKSVVILCAMATVVGISTGNPFGGGLKGNVAHASNDGIKTKEFKYAAATDNSQAEFAYEMAQITAKIIAAPNSAENFKVEFAYQMAQVTARVMPLLPNGQREEFAYEMAQLTTSIISAQSLDVEKAKAEFAYKTAQLTSKILTESGNAIPGKATAYIGSNSETAPQATGRVNNANTYQREAYSRNDAETAPKTVVKVNNNDTYQREAFLRNNANIAPKTADTVYNADSGQQAPVNDGYIAPETYAGLMDELSNVGNLGKQRDHKVNVDGELRFHYRLNTGPGQLGRDMSGLRLRLGLDTELYKDWRLYGMVEGELSFLNYNDELNFSRLYAAGKLGTAMVRAGSFGYLMADGNIYDSDFLGVTAEFGGPLKYTLSYGKTNETKNTFITTVRYNDFDYSLEAGLYNNRLDDGRKNTIWTFGGNYNFSNFSLGAMYLGSSVKDEKGHSDGYVLSFNYGDLKTWRPGTYDMFVKYYNQPRGTYLAHGMNGIGNWMHGFRGFGLGAHYTFAENFVGGMEYFDLRDKIYGEDAQTWWNQLTYYF